MFSRNTFINSRGSVIVTSVLLAAVLLVIGLGISELISREIRLKQNVIEAGKAYYAAEAGVETALLASSTQVVGFEGDGVKDEADLRYKYVIDARDRTVIPADAQVPCHNRREKPSVYTTIDPLRLWRRLNIQESVALPLFTYAQTPEGLEKVTTFDSFLVEFFVKAYPNGDQNQVPVELQEADVLRWKILALDSDGQTVSVSDYLPVYGFDKALHNSDDDPSKFGTGGEQAEYVTKAKFYRRNNDGSYVFHATYSVQDFLREGYSKPYLILTNVVTLTDLTGIDGGGEIYFRLVKETSDKPNFVCEYVKVTADGYAGNYRQSLDVELKLDSFLPVFDFALYRTSEQE